MACNKEQDLCELARRFGWVPENSAVDAVGMLTTQTDPATNESTLHLNCGKDCEA